MSEPEVWINRSPGDLAVELPEIAASDVSTAVAKSRGAFAEWRALDLETRKVALRGCQARIKARQEDLARLIALEMGKPLREARLELGAAIAKFDFVFADADRYVADQDVTDGPLPARVRWRPRGPSAVIAPFNFPIHLGHGAAVAYLLAGNPVLFKPSPLTANIGAAYAEEMQAALPDGVFELVQGGGDVGRELCLHADVRAICFTGSVPVGTALARELAADYSKSLALELGGVNSLIVCEDADLDAAAEATADGLCLTAGQRCNATNRILVQRDVLPGFRDKLLSSLARYVPGDPLDEKTMLGPLVSAAAIERYREMTALAAGSWILPGEVCGEATGHYVKPAVLLSEENNPFENREPFAPIATLEPFATVEQAVARQEATPYGLTASIFTNSEETFRTLGDRLEVGNLYQNLPTTFSPSALPFNGFRSSGNGKPGGRGFIRFAAQEQAVQWKRD